MTSSSDQLFEVIAKHAPDVPPEVLEAVVRLWKCTCEIQDEV